MMRSEKRGCPEAAYPSPLPAGVSSEALRHWLRQADADAGRGQPGELTTDEREELRRLRREHRVLKQERESLKKAAASFAQETR